jgi:lipopolysaccharide transport system permease protein
MAATIMLSLGIGLILGVLNAFMRDIGQVVPVLLQFGFWLTPIVYMPAILPEAYRGWLAFNPMYHVVSAYQSVLLYGQPPLWAGIAIIAVVSVGLLGLALLLFRKAAPEMVDAL